MEIYPLRFAPIFKERIWGGQKLKNVLRKEASGERVGESWEISGVPGDASVLINGPYSGRTLPALIGTFPEEILGADVLDRFGKDFPVLIKFIDAREDLSIQLHPDDTLARKRHNSFGKTEMWYIMDADPGAELIVGFEKSVSRETYQEALHQGQLPELLHHHKVRPSDAFFIESGTIHAIGGGILLAEIQQTSDVTYRVYDYERTDAQGNKRELHTELALDAMDFSPSDSFLLEYARESNRPNPVADCPYFKTAFLKLDRPLLRDLNEGSTFRILICLSGKAEVRTADGVESIRKGETLLIPAAARELMLDTTSCELLEVTL